MSPAGTRTAKVVVIGSSNTDLVVRTTRIPAPGETILGGDMQQIAGGKGANQAVAAARLGAETTFVARVGRDAFGSQSRIELGGSGVNTDYVVEDLEAPSGIALICVADTGENCIVVAGGANRRLSTEDIDAARTAITDCDILVLQLEIPLSTVMYAIDLAKTLGKRVILNPAPAQPLPGPVFQQIDFLTPNESEAHRLTGSDVSSLADSEIIPLEVSRSNAMRLRNMGVGTVIITMGAQGALACSAEYADTIVIPSPSVQAIDTTAAGDCFTGALAVAMAEGERLEESIRFANAAAALSVTRMGAQTSLPIREEVNRFLNEHASR